MDRQQHDYDVSPGLAPAHPGGGAVVTQTHAAAGRGRSGVLRSPVCPAWLQGHLDRRRWTLGTRALVRGLPEWALRHALPWSQGVRVAGAPGGSGGHVFHDSERT